MAEFFDKRVRFANNIITFYEYEKPLVKRDRFYLQNLLFERLPDYNFSFFDFAKFSKYLYKINLDIETCSLDYLKKLVVKFEKEIQEQITLFDNDEITTMKVLKANFNAKKDKFIDLVSANMIGHCFFVTLTYNEENKLLIDDLELSHKRFKRFIKSVNYNFYNTKCGKLKYVATWELQKKNERNALHYHVIFFDFLANKIDLNLLRKCWTFGSVNVKKINSITTGVSKYMSKYLLKDINDLVEGKKSYFGSKNLKRPFNDYVVDYDKQKNIITLSSGLVIDLKKYNIESVQNYNSAFNGNTVKTTFNKNI